ncbi:RDD family protein [Streptomyces sp. XM4011]|uniref:RDD family protein n=1 Tax=Streptomyces sp. XM4011 TaxID=2929780 RepID=UPI0024A6AF5C|nr:RDD family protein [Streptomyces sp. XM4011]
MSSPPAGSAGGSPGPNWYPDPSIPGYIRYWNGATWMPGTSRPEPRDGEAMPAPPPGAPAPGAAAPAAQPEPEPEPAPAGAGADEGTGGPSGAAAKKPDPRIDPRGQFLSAPRPSSPQPQPVAPSQPADRPQPQDRPEPVAPQPQPEPAAAQLPAVPEQQQAPALRPATPSRPALPAQAARQAPPEAPHEQTAQLRLPKGESWQHQVRELAQQAPQPAPLPASPGLPPLPAQHQQSPAAQPPQPSPAQQLPPAQAQPAPQVQQSPFLRSHQADPLTPLPFHKDALFGAGDQLYPAGPGRRLLARLLDSVLPLAAAGAVAAMVLGDARDHIQRQIDAANEAGVTREIWLIDGTTGGYLAMVLGVFLVAGFLFEALPTALWGRSPGKALCKLRVFDLRSQQKPSFGAAVLRWLVHGVLAVTAIGIVNVLWGLRDRPWRQCWHDKAAGTFVAG